MELTASNVHAILTDSLYKPEEVPDGKPPEDALIGHAVMRTLAFNPKRLTPHTADVSDMLSQLPDEFIAGGGWSFLNMCCRKDGTQWGEHINIDELIAIGSALGMVTLPLPREMWGVLPGGMPYVTVTLAAATTV